MPLSAIDFARKIKDILQHVQPLVEEAKAPILHYRRTIADIWGALDHIEVAFASTRNDLGFLKQFLDDTAEVSNLRIGMRLAELLTTIHTQAATVSRRARTPTDRKSLPFAVLETGLEPALP